MRVRKRSRGAEPAKAAKGAYIYLYCILCIDGGYIYIYAHIRICILIFFFLRFSLSLCSIFLMAFPSTTEKGRDPIEIQLLEECFLLFSSFCVCVAYVYMSIYVCVCVCMCLGLGCVSNPTESSRLEFLFIECTPTFQLAKLGRAPLAPPLQCRTLSL